jgi:Fe-S-cluster containining protein
MSREALTQEAILRDCSRMMPGDSFTFECNGSRECFTRCCADVAIVLTPYDVLRLKRALGMDSSQFLEQYTLSPFTKEQKFPTVMLRMDAETRKCPFVTEQGCRVYADRPWACRMYPLGVAEPRNPSAADRAFHFLVKEDLCQGHGQGRGCTVREWLADQGIDAYEMMGASFRDLMLHEFWDKEEPLTPQKIDMYYMACFDLDRFRRFVFETRFLSLFVVDEARVEALRTDDEELLEFAMQWLRFSLFGDKTMKLRPDVVQARRPQPPQTASGGAL